MKISRIEQTCHACPSQWDGMLDTGETFFAHYRHGYLQFTVTRISPDGEFPYQTEDDVFAETISNGDDGVMSTEEMMQRVGAEYSESYYNRRY